MHLLRESAVNNNQSVSCYYYMPMANADGHADGDVSCQKILSKILILMILSQPFEKTHCNLASFLQSDPRANKTIGRLPVTMLA